MRIDTWIPDSDDRSVLSLITVDTDDVWLTTFAHWDTLVDSQVAEDIATATVRILEASVQVQS